MPQPARDIARLLFGDYLFAFEVVGVLLLAAVIGGLYLARRDPDMPETNRLVARPGARHGRGERVSQSLEAYLVLSVLLFGIGVFGFLAKRNAIAMLMSIELMLNAVNLAIVAFGAFTPELAAQASTIALFVIAVAAGEATVGLAIVIAIYRNRRTPLVDEYASMRE